MKLVYGLLLESQASRILVLRISLALESPEGFVKSEILGPTPRVSDSEGLERDLRMSISHRFPGDTNAAGPGPYFENHCFWVTVLNPDCTYI